MVLRFIARFGVTDKTVTDDTLPDKQKNSQRQVRLRLKKFYLALQVLYLLATD